MFKKTMLCVIAVAALLAPAISANANEVAPDPTYYRNWLTSYGVVGSTQDALVKQLLAGELPDSMDSKAKPVSVKESTSTSAYTTISTFADGSILVTSRERPPLPSSGGVRPQAINGCKYGSGSGFATFTNCTISSNDGMYALSFKASYEQYSGGAQIDSAPQSSASVTVHYGDATSPTLSIKRAKQSGSLEAYAQEHSKFTSWTSQESEDLYLSLRVTSSKAWSTNY